MNSELKVYLKKHSWWILVYIIMLFILLHLPMIEYIGVGTMLTVALIINAILLTILIFYPLWISHGFLRYLHKRDISRKHVLNAIFVHFLFYIALLIPVYFWVNCYPIETLCGGHPPITFFVVILFIPALALILLLNSLFLVIHNQVLKRKKMSKRKRNK